MRILIRDTFIFIIFFILNYTFVQSQKYVEFVAKRGDRVENIFKKHFLPLNDITFKKFLDLNKKKTDKNFKLMIGIKYKLPILTIDEKHLENFIIEKISKDSIKNYKEKIIKYNNLVSSRELKKSKDLLWIPLHFFEREDIKSKKTEELDSNNESKNKKNNPKLFRPYYGKKIKKIEKKSNILKDYVFYLVSGHGGPDPGAIGYFEGYELHEDEYAYDITLRLAKYLESNGAKVYMITIDTVDGIRDDKFLGTSNLEIFYGGVQIPLNQKERLELCAKILNDLYAKESKNKNKEHISINIHLDSRSEDEKVDVFFYYQENNNLSKKLAEILQKTFEKQYEKYQPNRGYKGTVETRNLFMLRNSLPTTVYIELGNIKNRNNQYRFIDKNNRDALAKWLCLGIINFSKEKNNQKTTKNDERKTRNNFSR